MPFADLHAGIPCARRAAERLRRERVSCISPGWQACSCSDVNAASSHVQRVGVCLQERKGNVKERMREQHVYQEGQRHKREEAATALQEKLKSVPRALHRLHKRGRDA